MITGYTNFKTILARLYSELGILTEIPEHYVVEWVADALAMIGSYSQYEEMNLVLLLDEDGKVKLPTNFYKLIDIRYNGHMLQWSSNSFVKDFGCDECLIPTKCITCDSFSFYINNSFIISDIKTTPPDNELCISYLGVPVDDEGYPLVPDDIYFQKACVAYVTHRLDYRDFRNGNISKAVFDKSESDWLFYVNSARGSANMPNAAQLENLKNIMVRLIPMQDSYNNAFKNINRPERRRRF